jgi:hypothetical protein
LIGDLFNDRVDEIVAPLDAMRAEDRATAGGDSAALRRDVV